MRQVLNAMVLLAALTAGCADAPSDWQATRSTDTGAYEITVEPGLDPIVINRIHEWTLHVETPDGRLVENATIQVDGGMPEHQHGLPTRPGVTRYLGDGDYLVEGMKFNMTGLWELQISVEAGGVRDVATFELVLP
jgi:hypothetical protein